MENRIDVEVNGFHAIRENWPQYHKSVFMNKTEIVTDREGTIIGVTNPEKLLWAKIPAENGDVQILEVGKKAFSECSRLREITFSDNLEKIGEEAFKNCSLLSFIKIPETLYEIGEGAFEKTAIRSFVFSTAVEIVPSRCFMDDENLESVEMGENILSLGVLSFAGCVKLRSITIPRCVKVIPEGCFMRSGLRTVYLPRGIEYIGASAFASCYYLEKIFYDGREDDFRRIRFGANWNRGMNKDASLFLKDDKGCWYNAFSKEKKAVHEEDNIKEALVLFGLESIPTKKELGELFRKKAFSFHPDRLSGLNLDEEYTRFANEKFREYKEAYDTILPYAKK